MISNNVELGENPNELVSNSEKIQVRNQFHVIETWRQTIPKSNRHVAHKRRISFAVSFQLEIIADVSSFSFFLLETIFKSIFEFELSSELENAQLKEPVVVPLSKPTSFTSFQI